MTTKLDSEIDAALEAEERDLLRLIGEEPGFFSQALGLFGDRTDWINWLLMAVQIVLFVVAVWAGWRFFEADNVLEALRWGLPSAVLVLMALMLKLALWPTMQANRVIREVKRLELIVARGGKVV